MFIKLTENINSIPVLIRVRDVKFVKDYGTHSLIGCYDDITFSVEESADEILELLHKFGE